MCWAAVASLMQQAVSPTLPCTQAMGHALAQAAADLWEARGQVRGRDRLERRLVEAGRVGEAPVADLRAAAHISQGAHAGWHWVLSGCAPCAMRHIQNAREGRGHVSAAWHDVQSHNERAVSGRRARGGARACSSDTCRVVCLPRPSRSLTSPIACRPSAAASAAPSHAPLPSAAASPRADLSPALSAAAPRAAPCAASPPAPFPSGSRGACPPADTNAARRRLLFKRTTPPAPLLDSWRGAAGGWRAGAEQRAGSRHVPAGGHLKGDRGRAAGRARTGVPRSAGAPAARTVSALISADLPTPDGPASTDTRPASARASSGSPAPVAALTGSAS